MNNDDGVEEIDSLTSSPYALPLSFLLSFLFLHLSKEAEWAMKQRLCHYAAWSIREDEVLR